MYIHMSLLMIRLQILQSYEVIQSRHVMMMMMMMMMMMIMIMIMLMVEINKVFFGH